MKRVIYISAFLAVPLIGFAYSTDVDDMIKYFMELLRIASGFLSSLAFLFFFWTLIKFIWNSSEGKEDLAKNKMTLIWSGIALFMMFGIWGVVGYVQSSVGADLTNSDISDTPALPPLRI